MLKRKEIIFDSFLAGLLFLMVLLMIFLNSCNNVVFLNQDSDERMFPCGNNCLTNDFVIASASNRGKFIKNMNQDIVVTQLRNGYE